MGMSLLPRYGGGRRMFHSFIFDGLGWLVIHLCVVLRGAFLGNYSGGTAAVILTRPYFGECIFPIKGPEYVTGQSAEQPVQSVSQSKHLDQCYPWEDYFGRGLPAQ